MSSSKDWLAKYDVYGSKYGYTYKEYSESITCSECGDDIPEYMCNKCRKPLCYDCMADYSHGCEYWEEDDLIDQGG